jgi:hypothetical protein
METLVDVIAKNPFYDDYYGPNAPRGPLNESLSAMGSADAAAVLALDCEMVLTASCDMELARVTVVDADGKVRVWLNFIDVF